MSTLAHNGEHIRTSHEFASTSVPSATPKTPMACVINRVPGTGQGFRNAPKPATEAIDHFRILYQDRSTNDTKRLYYTDQRWQLS